MPFCASLRLNRKIASWCVDVLSQVGMILYLFRRITTFLSSNYLNFSIALWMRVIWLSCAFNDAWCSLTQMRKTCFELTSEYFVMCLNFPRSKCPFFPWYLPWFFVIFKVTFTLSKRAEISFSFQLSTQLVKCNSQVRNLSNAINYNRTFF